MMVKLFLMTLSTMRSGYGTMLVLMSDHGVMTGPEILIDRGTLRGGERRCRTGMHLLCQTKVSKVVQPPHHHRMLHPQCPAVVMHHHRSHHQMQATRTRCRRTTVMHHHRSHHPARATRTRCRPTTVMHHHCSHHPAQATRTRCLTLVTREVAQVIKAKDIKDKGISRVLGTLATSRFLGTLATSRVQGTLVTSRAVVLIKQVATPATKAIPVTISLGLIKVTLVIISLGRIKVTPPVISLEMAQLIPEGMFPAEIRSKFKLMHCLLIMLLLNYFTCRQCFVVWCVDVTCRLTVGDRNVP